MKIIDNTNRGVLIEGRNSGLGLAFVKLTDDTVELLMPLSACKDYLNDFVYVENHNRSVGTIYGYSHEPTGIFKEQDPAMIISILPLQHTSNIKQSDIDLLNKNYSFMQKFINIYEDLLFVKDNTERTTFIPLENNMILAKINRMWVKEAYAISLFSLLVRLSLYWNGEQDIHTEFLEKPIVNDAHFFADITMMRAIIKNEKLLFLQQHGFIEQKYASGEKATGRDVHNTGIASVNFKKE